MAGSKAIGGKAKRPVKQGGLTWPILAMLGFAAILVSGALPAACLFLPALLTLVVEQAPSRPLARVLLLFGMAGSWPALQSFWHAGSLRSTDWFSLLDLRSLAWAWLAQAAGWMLAEVLSLALARQADSTVSRSLDAGREEAAALRAEWNLPQHGHLGGG